MAVIYGEQNVDEKYSSIVEPNLYSDSVLIPNITYTDKYQTGPAGQIQIHKLTTDAVARKDPGADFVDEGADDELIPITLNNCFQKSRKIYGVQANAVAFNIAEEYLADSIKAVRDGREGSALACMAYEGTDFTTLETDAVDILLAMRKAVKDAKANPNFAIVSTEMYAELLGKIGIQSYADPAVKSAELLKRFGLNIVECNNAPSEIKYKDAGGTERTINLSNLKAIVGDYNAFSVVDNVDMFRIVDSENFNGVKAQVEINSGFKCTNAGAIQVLASSGSI